jgi:phosphate transport system substrate-binding protein
LEPLLAFEGELDIAGGTAHLPVMKEAARRIMQANGKVRITVEGGGSGVGVKKVGEGLVGIGNTGRPLSPEEVGRYGLRSFAFAVDGVAVAVHANNPVSALTTQQAKGIFAGKVTNWKEVGGADAAINLYGREDGSGTRSTFWKLLLAKGPVADKTNVVPSNGAMKTALGNDANAIGYLGIGHVDASVKAIAIDGIAATQENARNGTYKVTRRLLMNTKGDPSGLTRAFIDYIRSPEGSGIVADKGYIPLGG